MSDIKIVEAAIKESLQKFIGNFSNQATVYDIKSTVQRVLASMSETLEIKGQIPRVEVTQNEKDPRAVDVALFDAETGEPISVSDWASRSIR